MNLRDKRQHSAIALAFFLAFIACVAYLSANPQLTGISTRGAREVVDFGDGWTASDGTPVSLGALESIPGFSEHGATITRQFPASIEPTAELNFISSNLVFHVYYDNDEVYAFDPERSAQEKPYATHFNFVPLSSEDASKTVRIELAPVNEDSGSSIKDMRISETGTYIQRFVQLHGVALLESIVIVFVGLAVMALHIALRKTDHGDLNLLALGFVGVLLGVWSATLTQVLQLITGLGTILGALEYMTLLFVPYPIMRFASSLLQPRNRRRYDLAAAIIALCAIGATIGMAIATQSNMHDLLTISHAQLALCALLIIVELFSNYRTRGESALRDALKNSNALRIAFFIFVGCGLADFIRFFTTQTPGSDAAFFMRHGLFAFSLVLAIEASRASLMYIDRAHYADKIEVIAYTDALTNIGNRTAWKLMRDEVDAALVQGTVTDAVVCQFDVNFLKKVNDTMGHAAGDRYIKHAADTIKRSFGLEGTCYRTGGDEFTAIIAGDMLQERLDECVKLFETSIQEQSGDETPLSMSLGYAFVSETERRTVLDAQRIADERMYENKRAMKAERVD